MKRFELPFAFIERFIAILIIVFGGLFQLTISRKKDTEIEKECELCRPTSPWWRGWPKVPILCSGHQIGYEDEVGGE